MKFRLLYFLILFIPLRLFAAYTPSEWSRISGKPTFDDCAISGSYNHLVDTPVLHQVARTGNYLHLNNRPTLSTVATSGNYNDLINKPAADTANRVLFYNKLGRVTQTMKIYCDTITPSTASSHALNIAHVGYSTILSVNVTPCKKSGYSGGGYLNTEIGDYTSSSVPFNTQKSSENLVTVLSISVLGGNAQLPATNLTNIRLGVTIIGY